MPQRVASDLEFVQVSAGIVQSCGVTTSGAGYCWGDDTFGQLGVSPSALVERCGDATAAVQHDVPSPVFGAQKFTEISTGFGSHVCGVTTRGNLYCWGLGVVRPARRRNHRRTRRRRRSSVARARRSTVAASIAEVAKEQSRSRSLRLCYSSRPLPLATSAVTKLFARLVDTNDSRIVVSRAPTVAAPTANASPAPSPSPMHLDKKFLQRAFLAFTTGLFLACAARVSSASGVQTDSSSVTSSAR